MSSMGMDKSGNMGMAATTTATVTGWAVRAGYPLTVITSNALDADAAAPVIVQAKVTLTGAWGSGAAVTFRVLKNGVQIGTTASINFGGTTVTFANINTTLAVSDKISLSYTTPFGSTGTIAGGATNTYLFYDQQSVAHNADGVHTTTWGRSGELAVQEIVEGTHTTTWGRSAIIGLSSDADASHTTTWGRSGDIYQGQFYDVDAVHTTSWGISGDIIRIPKPANPPTIFTFNEVAFSVHTVDGRSIGDFPCDTVLDFSWGREMSEVSICDITVSTEAISEIVEDIRPWVHWVTVWHDGTAVWTGPIQSARIRPGTTSISARDTSTFMWRTRLPISRTWVETTPARIAELLWQRMLELHRIRTVPFVLDGVADESFTLTAQADQRMLYQFMDDLVKVGLRWTIIAGRPVLGTFDTTPVAELQECDFMVELERMRDGSQTFNDIRVQGQNYAQTVTAPLAGLHLQNIVSLDDVFGVSNITKAARKEVQEQAQIRDVIYVPSGATLHPEAPVTLDDLIPGKYFLVFAQGIASVMRLDSVNVTGSSSTFDVQVTLVADNPVSEFIATGGI